MNIIVTSGPTNERIDSVMKITNMSTGSLGATVANTLLEHRADEIDKIFYISTKLSHRPAVESEKVTYLTVESTEDMINTLTHLFATEKIDAMVHSAAVGDYKGKYAIRAENLIQDILNLADNNRLTDKNLMEIFENPKSLTDSSGKMSSYEPHLMVMLTLTPKVISMVKKVSPDTKLIGFKLLDGVSREELFNVASKLREKNSANYIVANDLSKIGNGRHWAMIVGPNGIVTECETKSDIANAIENLIFEETK